MSSTFMRSRVVVRALALLMLVGGLSVAGLRAQGQAEVERDVQELRQYRLTMEKVRQMTAASLAYAQAMERNPKAKARRDREKEIAALEAKAAKAANRLSDGEQKRLEELRAKQEAEEADAARQADDGDPKTLADMARRIEREPELAAAVRGVGLTTREFSMITLTFYNAMFAHDMKKAGSIAEMPKDILPENAAFIASNDVELHKMLAQLEAYEGR